MTLQRYLFGIAISTVFCFVAFGLICFYIDPFNTGLIGYLCFYASLFFGIVGFFTLVGFYLRLWFSRNEIIFAHVGPAFRQAILMATIVIGCLVLQSFRLLTWWDAALFVASVVLLEFFFISRYSRSYRRT